MPRLVRSRPDYRVLIENSWAGFSLEADMPPEIDIAASSSFDHGERAFTASELINKGARSIGRTGSEILGNLGSLLGVSGAAILQPMTKAVWQSSSPIPIQLPLIFDAHYNAKEEVHDIAVRLLALCLPVQVGNVLLPPNPPSFYGWGVGADAVNRTSLRIGRQFFFPSVAIQSVNYNAQQRLAADGYPIAGSIDVTFVTDYIYGRQDLLQAAGVQVQSGGSAP